MREAQARQDVRSIERGADNFSTLCIGCHNIDGTGAVVPGTGEGDIAGVDDQNHVLITQYRGDDQHTLIYDPARGAAAGDVSGRVLATSRNFPGSSKTS